MRLNRALGPDGFTVEFYQHCWPMIGDSMVNDVKYFFATREVFHAFNTTILSLIPKTKCPVNIKEYRPIACCNVIYKCSTKILPHRLKRVNGSLHGQFGSSRGLRQGDPISPYLFLIVIKDLTGILRRVILISSGV
ncbi:hypothetical protein LIER_04718 [Lithospermum erythrorhizon]|uniref:Reverse transcriptase n=1 Tax=Lithospermum erythrorhizon TaxID=34254 RepID=A0AAV3P2G1_LITER